MFNYDIFLLGALSIILICQPVVATEESSGGGDVFGCSDYSESDETDGYTCMCYRSCWEVSADNYTCMPQVNTAFSGGELQITVLKCGVDGFISLGPYSPEDTIPEECQYSESDTEYIFNVAAGECGTTIDEVEGETRYKATLKIWVEDPQNDTSDSLINRDGTWYIVESYTTAEQSLTVSENFAPNNGNQNISLTNEDLFAPITLDFDFYKDSSFTEAYDALDYPISYDLSDDIYFELAVTTSDTHLELFTTSCVAVPLPNPEDISSYVMLDQGCNVDTTLQKHSDDSQSMKNKFSVSAFQFKDSLEGITAETDVAIECSAVVCVKDIETSTCQLGCTAGDVEKRSIVKRSVHVTRTQDVGESTLEATSGTFHIGHSGSAALKSSVNFLALFFTALLVLVFM